MLTRIDRQTALAVPDLVGQWLQAEARRGASEHTLRAYRKGVDVYLAWLRENGVESPTAPEIWRYREHLESDHAVQTVNLRLSAVRSFYRWLVERGHLETSPAESVKGVKRSRSREHKRDPLTPSEVHALLNTCDQSPAGVRDRAMISLMVYCGLRRVEVHRADVDDLRTKGDRMVLYVQGKGRHEKDEFVVIPRKQESVMRAWLACRNGENRSDALFTSLSNRSKGSRLSLRAISHVITKRMENAGVIDDRKTVHSLRHTAINTAIKNGGAPLQVQKMARHASFDTTLGYIHSIDRMENPAEDLIEY